MISIKEEIERIKKGTEEIISIEELEKKLKNKGKLKVKWGADPTAPDLHLGHMVILRKLKDFQELGHEVIFLIGDFTAAIGDPSGRTEARPPLSKEKIRENATTYSDQVFKVLDRKKTKVVYNSSWLENLNLKEFLNLSSLQSVSRMLERNEFKERIKKEEDIRISEFLYPLIQSYDSVMLKADIEIGATEQKFNLLMGRTIQRRMGMEPQVVITLPVLEGMDGKRKMSKSFGNYIGLSEEPQEIFGKVMSIPDEIMFKYFLLLTDLRKEEVDEMKMKVKEGILHPKEVKEKLAFTIVDLLYTREDAEKAKKDFYAKHKRGLKWEERIKEIKIKEVKLKEENLTNNKIWMPRLISLTGVTQSNSEAIRLIREKAVEIDGEKFLDEKKEIFIKKPFTLKIGKRKVFRIIPP